jgi:hypothetical protein
MKQAILLSVLFVLISSCTRYEVRPITTEWLPDAANKWGVYRNGYLIPEYTATAENDYASSQVEAQKLFEDRKDRVEEIVFLKYEKPKRSFAHAGFFFVMLVEGPLHDLIFFMPTQAAEKLFHSERQTNFLWFPTTRFGFYEFFYGPTYFKESVFTATPPIRKDWSTNQVAQQEIRSWLQKSTPSRPSVSTSKNP